MADWTTEVFENEYLAAGGTEVHAVISVACANAGEAGDGEAAAEMIIVDTSGSMGNPHEKIYAARQAAAAAIAEIRDGTYFAVVSGTDRADVIYPRTATMVIASDTTRGEATAAVRGLMPEGGTAIGHWLDLATSLFSKTPANQCHAILLTDGENEHENLVAFTGAISRAKGVFQCDCRGVGDQWHVDELRQVSSALLGTVGLVAQPQDMAEDFRQMMVAARGRGVSNAVLKVWAPKGATVNYVKQVAPEIEDLTANGVTDGLWTSYPTGAWGDEGRDYHVSVGLDERPVGAEQLAARVQIIVDGAVVAQGMVKAVWSDDDTLTTRIDPAVAHYTGQADLAIAIQEGLAAKAAGDDATATVKLGRAVQLAAETGNDDATSRLKRVVEITDADTGTVQLKAKVSKLDELDLDTASTKTTRVR